MKHETFSRKIFDALLISKQLDEIEICPDNPTPGHEILVENVKRALRKAHVALQDVEREFYVLKNACE